eukprot:4318251-Pyramimonas_sp.AAC.1
MEGGGAPTGRRGSRRSPFGPRTLGACPAATWRKSAEAEAWHCPVGRGQLETARLPLALTTVEGTQETH